MPWIHILKGTVWLMLAVATLTVGKPSLPPWAGGAMAVLFAAYGVRSYFLAVGWVPQKPSTSFYLLAAFFYAATLLLVVSWFVGEGSMIAAAATAFVAVVLTYVGAQEDADTREEESAS